MTLSPTIMLITCGVQLTISILSSPSALYRQINKLNEVYILYFFHLYIIHLIFFLITKYIYKNRGYILYSYILLLLYVIIFLSFIILSFSATIKLTFHDKKSLPSFSPRSNTKNLYFDFFCFIV